MIGLIYKIFDNTNGNIYYGSTTVTISKRMTGHRSKYKEWVAGNARKCKSYDILKNGDYSYSLVEQVEYEDKGELLQRERWYIENNECVNKNIPTRSQDEKIEYHKEYNKEYYQQNREGLLENVMEYRQKNREIINEKRKQYREKNWEEISKKKKEYNQKNRERINEQKKEHYQRKKAEKENN